MQMNGIETIPTLGWSDDRSFEFCFEGIPKNGVVAVSSVGICNNAAHKRLFVRGFEKAIEVLEPTTVLFFGQILDEVLGTLGTVGTVVHYPHSFDVKFKSIRYGG